MKYQGYDIYDKPKGCNCKKKSKIQLKNNGRVVHTFHYQTQKEKERAIELAKKLIDKKIKDGTPD